MINNKKTIVFVSSIDEDWGGSEELWSITAIGLAKQGYAVYAIKNMINTEHPRFIELASNGIILISLVKEKSKNILNRISNRGLNITRRIFNKINQNFLKIKSKNPNPLLKYFRKIQPTLLIVSQGDNFDGLSYAFDAMEAKIPYITISQKAKETSWPFQLHKKILLETLNHAKYCFFVSKHNLTLTEEQFGRRLSNAKIIQNPIKIKKQLVFPEITSTYNLVCIGRYYLLDKGQDILIRILAKDKWKERPIQVTFIGSGPDKDALISQAKLLNVTNLTFLDHLENIEEIIKTHHALILPSRNEGMPLSILEAMAAGRPIIASNAGGNAEVVEEGYSGFIGEANVVDFEKAMERAWQRKDEWKVIGNNAANYINNHFLKQSDHNLLNLIKTCINEE